MTFSPTDRLIANRPPSISGVTASMTTRLLPSLVVILSKTSSLLGTRNVGKVGRTTSLMRNRAARSHSAGNVAVNSQHEWTLRV